MQQISESLVLLNTINNIRGKVIFSIEETLRNRNHGLIVFKNSITNNWIDDSDNEQITGYYIDGDTVQIEMNGNEYDIELDELKVEVLIKILQAIEAEDYTDAMADDDGE
jgi:hypothetical protein